MKNTARLNKLTITFLILLMTGCTLQTSLEKSVDNTINIEETTSSIASVEGTLHNEANNTNETKSEKGDKKMGVWSPDGKWVAITTVARTWIDTVILDTGENKEYETKIFKYIIENAEKYDYKIGENQRPDPYVNFLEWCPDSKKVLLSYGFTDDFFTRQTGVSVFNLEKMSVDWMIKLAPAEGEHAEINKPEGFRWEASGYGIETGLISKP